MNACLCNIIPIDKWLEGMQPIVDERTGLPRGLCPACGLEMNWERLCCFFDWMCGSKSFRPWLDRIDLDLYLLDHSWSKTAALARASPVDSEESLARLGLQRKEFFEHRDARGYTWFHVPQNSSKLTCGSLIELNKLLDGGVDRWDIEKERPYCSREQHASGNARIAIVALLAVLEKLGVYRDIRVLIGRAVYEYRFHYRWTIGQWRSHAYVWGWKQ